MGLPAGFRSRIIWPIQLVELSAVTTVDATGNRYIVPAARTATRRRVKEIHVVNSLSPSLDAAAVRAVRTCPDKTRQSVSE